MVIQLHMSMVLLFLPMQMEKSLKLAARCLKLVITGLPFGTTPLTTTFADLDSISYKYVSITPIDVRANKRFVVSINVLKEAFEIRDNTGIDFMPFYSDGITIHYYSDAKTSTQTFPERATYAFKIAGLVDFVFVAD